MANSRKNRHVRAATLADVGRAAGVSAMAASVVLNNARSSSRISEETRERILKVAAALHYRPNATARALANRRMHTLGVAAVVHDNALNYYFMQVFTGILEAAARHEQNTTVFTLHDWNRDVARLRGFCDGRIDGLILVAPLISADQPVLPTHTPFVSIHANADLPNVVNIESDEEHGVWEMVRYLIAQGHRRIMHIRGPLGLIGAERRCQGYRRALASARIPFDPDLLITGNYSTESGRETMGLWLKKHAGQPLPQAIYCASDAVAIGCMETLAEAGIRVPDDVSVAGFDDTLGARTCVPQLTTMRQPLHAMGERAVELLLARIARQNGGGRVLSGKTVVFPVELMARASVAAPPAAVRMVPVLR
ncbi:MAG TPA: LacI family DNA-binding transcriptional regulator [Lacunisphaera sp.]|nr:LacI family DNA-binding transcriptional regulator [Lacunisphaera sp.]